MRLVGSLISMSKNILLRNNKMYSYGLSICQVRRFASNCLKVMYTVTEAKRIEKIAHHEIYFFVVYLKTFC